MAAMTTLMLGATFLIASRQWNLDVNDFGWKVKDGRLEIDWDDPQNFEQVKESVHLLLRGCGCK